MARTKNKNVEEIYEENTEALPDITQEEMEEYQDEQEMENEENLEDDMALSEEVRESDVNPEPDEQHNAHTILNKAVFNEPSTLKTTFLTEPELGRPLFTVRFMLDLHKSAVHYGLNRIKSYYRNKIENTTSSGLSNRGFSLNLNVTQRRDTTRRRVREIPKPDKK